MTRGMSGWWRIAAIYFVAVVCSVHLGAGAAKARPDGSYPRIFNHDWRNTINATFDSRYDLLVVSTRVQNDQLDSLRMFNPTIKRLASLSWYMYFNAGPSGYPAQWGPFDSADPAFGWDRMYWDLLEENDWWLYGRDSSGVQWRGAIFWDTWAGNFSSKCPPNAQGDRLCDVFGDFLIDNLVNQRSIDGLFFDNCWDSPNHLHWQMWGACPSGTDCSDPAVPRVPESEFEVGFDLNMDSVPDHPDSLKKWWFEGVEIIMDRIRQRMGPEFILVGNAAHHYTTMNGAMYERFPRLYGPLDPEPNPILYRWYSGIQSPTSGYLEVWEQIFSSPRYNLIDTERSKFNEFLAQPSSYGEQFKRWTLGSTLLGDGYYTSHGHGSFGDMWWEPEYDIELGWPTGAAYTVDIQGIEIWKRDFTLGEVWVNPTATAVGSTETNPAIPSRDAIILLSPTGVPSGPTPGSIPGLLSMETPFPNPTTESAAIQFRLDPGAPATLRIFDISGRLVSEIWTGVGTGTMQTAYWSGLHDFGYEVGPGIYFATLSSGSQSVERRMVRLR